VALFWEHKRRYGARRIWADLSETEHNMIQSMTRPDNHYDNAFAESLFSRFKAELSADWPFKDFEYAHIKTFEYIEGYYNRKRRHSSLGYLSPQAFENRCIQIKNVKEQ
jgi:putative transposase